MDLLTIFLFLVYSYCLGFTVESFARKAKDSVERNVMRIAIGLAVLPVLIAFISFVRLPVDWRIILIVSIIYPVFFLVENFRKIKSSIKQFKVDSIKINPTIILLLIIFAFVLFMYLKGAFAYPYFEDDDPWEHAKSVKYIAIEKVLKEPDYAPYDMFLYLDPRPPAYDSILAILYQTSSSLMWTMKFFNALFISLGILFFYFFMKRFSGSSNKALFATFVLAMVPAYLSHFIWSHGYMMTLFIVAFYCLEMMRKDGRWLFPTTFIMAAIFLTQETQAVKFAGLFSIYWIIRVLVEKRFLWKELLAPVFGFLISFVFWWFGVFLKFGSLNSLLSGFYGVTSVSAATSRFLHPSITKVYFGVLGSGTRQHGIYTLKDFFIATSQNMINNPLGVGIIVGILFILGIAVLYMQRKYLLKAKKEYLLITLFWLFFTFLGVHGGTHWWSPFALFPFRFWMLFAIPVAILAAEGFVLLLSLGKGLKINRFFIVVLIVILVFFTAGYQKYQLNTMQWSPGGDWKTTEEFQGYLLLSTLPEHTKTFSYSIYGDKFAISYGMDNCPWCSDEIEFRSNILHTDALQVHSFLKSKRYDYLILDQYLSQYYLTKQFGENETNRMIPLKFNEIINSTHLFQVAHMGDGMILLKII